MKALFRFLAQCFLIVVCTAVVVSIVLHGVPPDTRFLVP